ncbi:hypothetical protein GCM10023336_62610 [Streptomyces similanensis]|uniref:Uncharacterized protein n=1 Tax=Streptomyces similanensis TaxID=1274988 RepID=A0ABP9LDX4_9ACTN
MLKRQMFGRAGFDLLRKRVLVSDTGVRVPESGARHAPDVGKEDAHRYRTRRDAWRTKSNRKKTRICGGRGTPSRRGGAPGRPSPTISAWQHPPSPRWTALPRAEKASKPLGKEPTEEQEAHRQKDIHAAADALEQARKWTNFSASAHDGLPADCAPPASDVPARLPPAAPAVAAHRRSGGQRLSGSNPVL